LFGYTVTGTLWNIDISTLLEALNVPEIQLLLVLHP